MPITWRLPYGLVATVIFERESVLDVHEWKHAMNNTDDDDRLSRGRLRDRMTDSPTAASDGVK